MSDPGSGRLIGRTISHYRVIAPLGAGGMGVVYRGEDVRLGRPVAIKLVADDFAHDTQAVARLRAEARAASALNHPNICTIHDIGTEEGRPFIVMELMEGQTLRDRLARGHLKVHDVVDYGIQIADALHSAHSAGILHRDIKPANIFVTARGHLKLLDFGLAKLTTVEAGAETATIESAAVTAAGTTLGTVSYMSPEQAAGEDLDGRTDLFSLGVVLYECATGRLPFEGRTTALILSAILNKAPLAPSALNPDLPARLQEIILTCLEKDRELRYQSGADLRADLKRVRRDLESGRMQTAATVAVSAGQAAESETRSPSVAPPSSGAVAAPATKSPSAATRSRVPLIAGSIVTVGVIAAVAGYAVRHSAQPAAPVQTVGEHSSSSPEPATAGQTVPPAMQPKLSLAESNFAAGNFRAAQAYAAEVLASDPTNSTAIDIRQKSAASLERFDNAISLARQRLAAGDVQAAARALTQARDIDSTSPVVTELAATLAQRVRDAGVTAPARGARPVDAKAPSPSASAPASSEPTVPPPPAAAPAPPIESAQTAPRPPIPAPASPSQPPSTPGDSPAAVDRPSPPRPSVVPAPAAAPAERTSPPPAPPAPVVDDDAAVRRVIANYGHAIETKDLALFRTVKPNLSREEERRLQDGFRAVASQQVRLALNTVDIRGQEATVVAQRSDTIDAGGRRQTVESRQTFRLTRSPGGWIITDIR